MKKIWTLLSLSLVVNGANAYSSYTNFEEVPSQWTGFYIGANAGYAWTADDITTHYGEGHFANPLFLPNSRAIANALAIVGNNVISNNSHGFMGGAQIGYNSQFADRFVVGLDADIDAIGQSNTTSYATTTVAAAPITTYTGNIVVTKKLDYLGLLKGRLGVLATPTFLIYGAGGLSYGQGSSSSAYSVTNTQPLLPPLADQNTENKLLAGWVAGAGAEWLFAPCWSVKLEYLYYYLGPIHSHLTLAQNLAINPPVTFASAEVESIARFTENTVRLGVNYRFA